MKKQFFDHMLTIMDTHPKVYLLFCGLGWPRMDEFLQRYPGRAFNCEASEQSSLDMAVGLAYDGKIPFVYTITPFLLRGFETIRTYINHEKLNVKMVGVGRDDEYGQHDGFSHDATDVPKILRTMEHVEQYYPDTIEQMQECLDILVNRTEPAFISILR